MSEETRLTLEKLGMPSALLEALTAHMRDELAPKPGDRGTHIDIGDPAPWDADDGPRIQRAIDLAASKVKPTQAKCDGCGETLDPAHAHQCTKQGGVIDRGNGNFTMWSVSGPKYPPGHPQSWERWDLKNGPAKCEECGETRDMPHDIACERGAPPHSPIVGAQPSPTTEAPELNEKGQRPEFRDPSGTEWVRKDVVEKRVAEALLSDRAERMRPVMKAVRGILGARDGDTAKDYELVENAARRVVAELEDWKRRESESQEAYVAACSREATALARVKELEAVVQQTQGVHVSWVEAEKTLRARAETAERELSEERRMRAEDIAEQQRLRSETVRELGEARAALEKIDGVLKESTRTT